MAKSQSPNLDLGSLQSALVHARISHAANVQVLKEAQIDHERSRQALHDATAALDTAVRQILAGA